jgi:hypothetical protein
MVKKKRVRVSPVTVDRRVKGWTWPGRTHIRLARPGDIEQVTGLLVLADIPWTRRSAQ